MSSLDPFASMMSIPGVGEALLETVEAINQVQRRPQALRQSEVISSMSLLRGASTLAAQAGQKVADAVHVYVVASPELVDATVRTFQRAPLQVIADLDRRAGGTSFPIAYGERVQALGAVINRVFTHPGGTVNGDRLLPLLVAAEISSYEVFGNRSEIVATVASRICAVATGLDPRGITVPELYTNRHRADYAAAQEDWRAGRLGPLLIHLARAWQAGAKEAQGIIASL
ncbi:MAG: oxidoreductase [Corynebacterium sp.]|nr:oxidoreductase [Corynebacterium sp.]